MNASATFLVFLLKAVGGGGYCSSAIQVIISTSRCALNLHLIRNIVNLLLLSPSLQNKPASLLKTLKFIPVFYLVTFLSSLGTWKNIGGAYGVIRKQTILNPSTASDVRNYSLRIERSSNQWDLCLIPQL